MKELSLQMKDEAIKDLKMYYGEPPYDIEYIRRYRLSGLFEQQALAKYGLTPVEMIKALQENHRLDADSKEEAVRDIRMYFGDSPIPKEMMENRLSSGLLEMQVLAKYSMTVGELIRAAGFEVTN
ncbi:MAG: hypothetical protein PHN75_12565 [Syntrophales bacterium]|nr:hypothetical protein [Syntrophales bacterium]